MAKPPINAVMGRLTDGQDFQAGGSSDKRHQESRSLGSGDEVQPGTQLPLDGFDVPQATIYQKLSASSILTDEDVDNITALAKQEIAENTRLNYGYQWRRFAGWAESIGKCPLPAHPDLVTKYIAHRRLKEGHRTSTLRAALASIRRRHEKSGFPDPCATVNTRAVVRGAARDNEAPPKQAPGLMKAEFARVQTTAYLPRIGRGGRPESRETAERRGKLDIALIGLMRDSLLRPSEAVAAVWGDVVHYGDGTGRLHIRRSKVDQEGEGAVGFVSEYTMLMLGQVMEVAERTSPSDSIFGLKRRQLSRRIKQAAIAAGLGDGYSGYSPRVGMARDLARSGTELPSLMQVGRWKSPRMPAHYIREEEAGRNAVARYYGYSL